MPNWCSNVAEFSHDDPAMIARLKKADEEGNIMKEFFPCPPELYEGVEWYNWCIANWGTKWDFGHGGVITDEPTVLKLSFDTAWAPPTAAYEKLTEMGFQIYAKYYEPGVGFCGYWEDGDDEHYDIEEFTVDWIKANIPEGLDDQFGISEEAKFQEEDNAEDDSQDDYETDD